MEMDRLFKIIMSDLTSERMKMEEELEFVINSREDIHTKVSTIKKVLERITINEASMMKFASMIPNNNLQNNENDGTV
jgi:hypothetical protein